jgi:hypothetical protein
MMLPDFGKIAQETQNMAKRSEERHAEMMTELKKQTELLKKLYDVMTVRTL